MKGVWNYQSFLVLPTDGERDASAGSPVTAKKWALGKLVVLDNTADEFSGELVFTETVKLHVKGKILPATNDAFAVLDAIGEATAGPAEGAIYKISGWINSLSSDQAEPTDIRGSILAVRGPNSRPKTELGGMPIGTVGTFALVQLDKG